jgi:hypothetical protein
MEIVGGVLWYVMAQDGGITRMRRLPWDSSSILASYGQNILLIYILIVALFDF